MSDLLDDLFRAPAPSKQSRKSKASGESWRDLLTKTKSKIKGEGDKLITRATAYNVSVFVTSHPAWAGVLGFDERQTAPVYLREPPFGAHYAAQRPTPCPRRLTDSDASRIRAWLEVEEHLGVRIEEVRAGVLMGAQLACFDPVRTYLDALAWDGVRRLDTWVCDYLGSKETPYTRAVAARFMIGAVARCRAPGCKVDTMPILEGGQGAGKSQALAALSPEPGWFTDELADLRSKDAPLGLGGKWIVELAELAAIGRADGETLKAFLSRGVDRFRAPYAASSEDYPRRCVFIGSTNADAYLRDETGGRRFWPIKVGRIFVEELKRDRDQLWAEADARYQAGEPWWMHERELTAEAEAEQGARYAADSWEETISAWLEAPLQANVNEFTISDLLRSALGLEAGKHDQAAQNRAVRAFKRLGWTRKQARRDGARVWFYVRPSPLSPVERGEEVNR